MRIYSDKAIIAIFLFTILSCGISEKPREESAQVKRKNKAELTAECRQPFHLRRGSNFFELLKNKMGFSAEEAAVIINSVRDSLPFNRLNPKDEFFLCWNNRGEKKRVIYRPYKSPKEWDIEIIKNDSTANFTALARIYKQPVIRKEKLFSTKIEETLYNAFIPPFKPELVYKITEILQWDIDFFIDPRKGDKIIVLFDEEYTPEEFLHYGSPKAIVYITSQDTITAFYYPPTEEYYDLTGRAVQKTFLKSPLRYSRISSTFSRRRFHPIKKIYRPHNGVDFAAPYGTPVSASADGTVIFKGWKNGYGNTIIIRHGSIYKTLYGHLSGFKRGLRTGKRVKQNEVIGFVGSTGTATGNHLHYTFYKNGVAIDPLKLKNPPGKSVPEKFSEAYRIYAKAILEILLEKENGNTDYIN